MRIGFAIFGMVLFAAPAVATTPTQHCAAERDNAPICISLANFAADTCLAIEVLAARNRLNPHFFTRLIWQESHFNPNARSPANAQGIAQFIPSTAKIKGLNDPFNPAEALTVSARYLAELTEDFGNEGLAAVAYNAGEVAAANYRAKLRNLPNETWNYVQIITGHTAAKWRDKPPQTDFHLNPGVDFFAACLALAQGRQYTKYTPAAQFAPWGVQLAAGSTRGRAAASYRRNTAQCKRLLVGKSPDYISKRAPSGGRKRIYTARIGYEQRSDALRLCARLKQRGCSCAVYKN